MIEKEGHIDLSAAAQQDMHQEAAMQQFREFLAEFDICVTNEAFEDGGIGDVANFRLACHLQAPTIYDVAVRVAKAGWTYTDATEDRAAPCLTGPDGEQVRITRGPDCARMIYMPANADVWARLVRQRKSAVAYSPAHRNLPAAAGLDFVY